MFWHGLSHLKNKSAGSVHGLQTLTGLREKDVNEVTVIID